jgi:hypothetical protein
MGSFSKGVTVIILLPYLSVVGEWFFFGFRLLQAAPATIEM